LRRRVGQESPEVIRATRCGAFIAITTDLPGGAARFAYPGTRAPRRHTHACGQGHRDSPPARFTVASARFAALRRNRDNAGVARRTNARVERPRQRHAATSRAPPRLPL